MTDDGRKRTEYRDRGILNSEWGMWNDGAGIGEFGIWKAEKIVYGRVHRAGA